MKLRKKLGIWRAATLKNRLPLPLVANHFLYNNINKLKHKFVKLPSSPEAKLISNEIQYQGYSLREEALPTNLIKTIKSKSDKFFKDPEISAGNHKDAGLFRIKDCLLNIPEIEEILALPIIYQSIFSFYGGNFRLFDADLYKTTPKDDPEASFGSQEWHFDNVTTNMLKLMVYLNDVKAGTGAMKLVPKQLSHEIRKSGFTKRSLASQFEKEIVNSSLSLEAKAGSFVFFQPQYCIHKAVEPAENYRDVIVFMLYPSISSQKKLSESDKILSSSNRSHIINLFTGKAV